MNPFRAPYSISAALLFLVCIVLLMDIYLKLDLHCKSESAISTQQIQAQRQIIKYVQQFPNSSKVNENENPLDNCYHVYLDVGSNIGIQIRKLFEPSVYPDAAVHPIYDLNFGTFENRQRYENEHKVCTVGFEPNFQHTAYLKNLEKIYNDCGWKVKIFTETAVSDHNGAATFFFSRISQRQIGGGIVPPNQHYYYKAKDEKLKSSNVTLLRLSEFLINVVRTRKIPTKFYDPKFPPRVVMKMDIEGSEIDVLPDLIFTGSLQYINRLMIEWHLHRETQDGRKLTQSMLQSALRFYTSNSKENKGSYDFQMLNLDDETYFMSSFDLPKC